MVMDLIKLFFLNTFTYNVEQFLLHVYINACEIFKSRFDFPSDGKTGFSYSEMCGITVPMLSQSKSI